MIHHLSPSDIEVLLHCHVCPEPHPRQHAPAVSDFLDYAEDQGWIVETSKEGVYTTTDLGRAYVDLLCATPPPVAVYVDPRTKEVIA